MLNGKTIIKSIGNKHGEVALVQADNDCFYVRTETYGPLGENIEFSSEFRDYNMANCLFQIKTEAIGAN